MSENSKQITYRWEAVDPHGDEVLTIVCPQCGSMNAKADRVCDFIYGWCLSSDCGWDNDRYVGKNQQRKQQWLKEQMAKAASRPRGGANGKKQR